MIRIAKENIGFLIPLILILGILGLFMLTNSKAEIHLFLNGYHNLFFNYFFRLSTFLGDGLTPTILSIILLFVSFRKGLIVGVGGIIVGVFSQFFKRVVFYDVMRPKAYFEGVAELYFVPGVDVHTHFSFPSGHTTTAFCLFFVLAYFTRNNWLKSTYLVFALIAGYSRIYLSQHFLIDVYFGALLGVISAFISILIFEKPPKAWLDKSLITIFKVQ